MNTLVCKQFYRLLLLFFSANEQEVSPIGLLSR